MYKFQNKQATIYDFDMPLGLTLSKSNRWVIKAGIIPWDAIERRYAELFKDSTTGNVAIPARLALGSLLIQKERGTSDEETVLQIQECHALQYFCGLPRFTEESPFHSSNMSRIKKRFTDDILKEINEMVIAFISEDEEQTPPKSDDDPPQPP